MASKGPVAARYFYFHVENSDEIKALWMELAKSMGIKLDAKDPTELVVNALKSHGITVVTAVKGKNAKLSVLLYRNVVIISGLFNYAGEIDEVIKKVDFKDLPSSEITIGGAIVVMGSQKELDKAIQALGPGFTVIETNTGTLYQFDETPGEKKHFYYLSPIGDADNLEHFLLQHFPPFDFAIHKLHMERDYFKNQRKWVITEKSEIDKTIGDILHKRIVGETLNPAYINVLEKEIDTLSTKYAILVNDGHLIRKARTTLEDDIDSVYSHLNDFTKILPEGSLEILRPSMELKKKLLEDELSLSYAIKNTKTAIDIVRMNVDLLRSRENIFLQEEAISFQVAAGVLEFIIIFYYGIASWEHLIGVERLDFIPPPTRFISIFLFASFAVLMTHFVGVSFKEKWKVNKGMIISGAALIAVFIYIVFISIGTGGLHT